jgi:hypothetical protein
MSFPSFATGEVLTAADMNAVGLWLVKSQTIGTGVSSVTVSDAFSSLYDTYLITISGGSNSADSQLNLRLGAVTSGYRYQYIFGTWAGTASAVGSAVATSFEYVGTGNSEGLHMNCVIMSPNLAKSNRIASDGSAPGAYSGNTTGFLAGTTQYTAFTIFPVSGTMTGGTIRVYGYRN